MTVCIPTKDGIPYVQWINTLFGDCVYGNQDAVSLLLGYISICFWLNAQLPQVIENYKMGSADCLSLNFLSIWLAGDTANLIGTILTDQLPFQFYLGIYFVSIDICLLCQWIYYNKYKKRQDEYVIIPQEDVITKHPSNSLFQHPAIHSPVNIPVIMNDETTPFSSSASPSKWYTLSLKDQQKLMSVLFFFTLNITSPTQTTTQTIIENNFVWIGRISAWTCTTLYLLSRIPQILKNRRRQSIEGLSISLFVCAACANLTYSLSILTHPGHTIESLLEALPYLIGSCGTLIFDFFIFCQFLYYTHYNKPTVNHVV
ncbi:hypothetical protein BCV72DRAFT_231265 [Rhizopus microsporus var. microsporus]|uniref:PQ-loop-domain-containing protein n=2 Tax=Rhizopus microsporus TaxID=58291 RepID=A0A2G4T3A9_RHIZD|nr:uncharacterized protein RHIMIDRAFT_272650 [Rhizopus microsporus ATCC 52813]ORE04622.1 hypothetical protein BCV72DRAFT_231265 [Rhizopus microsporus var. microsporus]PHZ15484.1 hypothetical protein RHIMIDRAFT_272650 [Rhizopus microsporus ATCC 52813]